MEAGFEVHVALDPGQVRDLVGDLVPFAVVFFWGGFRGRLDGTAGEMGLCKGN
jgi:hypothetical protein